MRSIRIAAIFIWVGFVCAISFMEAWLKFTAPGVSLTVGLSIGQVVFHALNKVELVLALIIIGTLLNDKRKYFMTGFLVVALVMLCLQTLYVLPQLSERIDMYLKGDTPQHSQLHTLYVGIELLKVIALFIYGFKQIKK